MSVVSRLALGLLGAALASLFLQGLGVWAVRKQLRRSRRPQARLDNAGQFDYPPISLLKPLKGHEDELLKNLRSFFEQDYPGPMELVFSAESQNDPGLELAREIARDFPDRPSRFVVSDPSFGLNPKVANLQAAFAASSFDLVLQTDGNVRLDKDYLSRTVFEFETEGAALLSSIVRGAGERTIGSALENLQLNAFTAPAVCVALHVAHIHVVIGKAMMFRRSELAELGGFGRVRNVLAEDFVLGQLYQRAGKKLLLSSTTVTNINTRTTISRFFRRHLRWLQMRAVVSIPGFVADLGANPIPLAVGACILSGGDAFFFAILAGLTLLKVLLDQGYVRAIRGYPMRWSHMPLVPAKDLLVALAWVVAVFRRRVSWRGQRLRMTRGSNLAPLAPATDQEASIAFSEPQR